MMATTFRPLDLLRGPDAGLPPSYWRSRYYEPTVGRFSTLDPFAGISEHPPSLHRYLYADANAVSGIDPSGMMTTTVETSIVTLVQAILLTGFFWYFASGQGGRDAMSFRVALAGRTSPSAYNYVLAKQAAPDAGRAVAGAVQTAIDNNRSGLSDHQIRDLPIFFVFRSRTPDIYAHDHDAIIAKPWWIALRYLGTGPSAQARKLANRNAAIGGRDSLRDPVTGRTSLDEYPFASTFQGGNGASVRAVPPSEQNDQRNDLSAFYRSRLAGQPEWFLVVPLAT